MFAWSSKQTVYLICPQISKEDDNSRSSCFKCLTSRSKWNLEVLVFVEGGKRKKSPQSKMRAKNKLNPNETASMGKEPGSQRSGSRTRVPILLSKSWRQSLRRKIMRFSRK